MITANEEELRRLRTWVDSPVPIVRSRRAMVVLLSMEGATLDAIQAKTELSRKAVVKWRTRFRLYGLAGLNDAKRNGRPRTIQPDQLTELLSMAWQRHQPGSQMTIGAIAKKVGISASTTQRYLTVSQTRASPQFHQKRRGQALELPHFTTKVHSLLGIFAGSEGKAFAIGHRPCSFFVDHDLAARGLRYSFGREKLYQALYEHCKKGNPSGSREHRSGLAEFPERLARYHPRTGITVFVNASGEVVKDMMARKRRKTGTTLYMLADHAAWISAFEIHCLTFPEHLSAASPWRTWEEHVHALSDLLREVEVVRNGNFQWLNRYGIQYQ